MSCDSTVRVPTAHAGRYLQQLCKHWAHNLARAAPLAFDWQDEG